MLALDSTGHVWAWGNNHNGQCGNDESNNEIHSPVQVLCNDEALSHVVAISAQGSYSLALKDDGTVYQWGATFYGTVDQATQIASLSGIMAIEAGGVGAGHVLQGIKLSYEWDHEGETNDTGDWVYLNYPYDDDHAITMSITVDDDPNDNTSYSISVAPDDSDDFDCTITDGAGDLLVEIKGGDTDASTPGEIRLSIVVEGETQDEGGQGYIGVTIKLRPLGDIDDNGGVEPTDLSALISKLNGLYGGNQPARAFDLDNNGGAEPTDLSMLINILNGM